MYGISVKQHEYAVSLQLRNEVKPKCRFGINIEHTIVILFYLNLSITCNFFNSNTTRLTILIELQQMIFKRLKLG